jgi:DNA replication protein
MYNLIKNNIIQFDKLIIEKYNLLGLDEVDAIILIRLNDLLNKSRRQLLVEEIAPTMKISIEVLSERIVDLVKRGFITLELSSIDSKEVFSLDESYRRLAYLLNNEASRKSDSELNKKMIETVKLLEHELKKILSPIELEMVSRWYIEDDYSDEEINEAILKALKTKTRGVSFIDRSLSNSRKIVDKKIYPDNNRENVQEMFNKVYVKSR